MDDQEFGRLLDLFPVVRPRNYHIETDPSKQSTSRSFPEPVFQEEEDAFWEKLKLAVEKKAGAAEAQRFCKAFQEIHRKLVYEELSLDAACSFINLSKRSGQ
uniref:Uncharacterized protein n=1 Tax=Populus trichocarpa TaxID=3694 RepID=A0A2K2C4L4_POPTR